MRIGLYVGKMDPLVGGESSLTITIIDEIKKNYNNHFEYVFLYLKDSSKINKTIYKGYKFISIDHCVSNSNLLMNGLIESLGGASSRFYKLDKVAKKEKIDFIYFAAPVFAQTSLPYIFTVWDLGHRTTSYFPEVSGVDWGYREKMYKKMLPRATYIITANQTGKKEIIKYYNIDEDRIKIVPFPVTLMCKGDEKKPNFVSDKPFFFYPAQFWPHKNHIVIVEAMAVLRDKYGLKPLFYLTGGDKGNKSYIEKKVIEYELENQVLFTGFISNEELKYLYTHASAMVFASLMGPNNLPPVEAVYLKCPIIISDIPGHREEMGNIALYFDGYNPDDLANKLKQVLDNSSMSTKMVELYDNKIEYLNKLSYFDEILFLFFEIEKHFKRWK